MRISLGQRAHDAHPVTTECDWSQFVQWLYAHQRTTGEKDGPYICLAEFTPHAPGHVHPVKTGPACPSPDPYRSLSTLVASCGVPLDFDKGTIGPDDIARVLVGYAYVAYTTYKHTDAAPRWRVFVPVAAPMDAATHKATWNTLNAAFSDQADHSASDASRLSYLPNACVEPSAARIFHADGALLQPTQAAPSSPVVKERGDGPVPGWAGPTDDATLLTIAANTRQKPSERFGGPIHFAMLWAGNADWLAQNFPPSSDDYGKGRTWNATQADAALANELMYFTGGDTERAADLMRRSGLSRDHDDDWSNRKVYAALALAMNGRGDDQFHFMGKVPTEPSPAAPTDAELADAVAGMTVGLSVGGVPVPAGTSDANAIVLMNAPPGSSMNDFYAFLPDHTYIHRPSGVACSSASVDEVIGKEARQVLAPTVPVHSYTWAPGFPERFTLDVMDPTHEGGEQVWMYNQYRAPRKVEPAFTDVSPWLNLLHKIFPDDAEHILSYFADAVQFPGRKCNHALVMGSGVHGTGKDTLLVGLQHAVGNKNFRAIKPHQVAETFTPWMRSVVVQISESRDMGEGFVAISRFELYERCKDLAAAPPLALDCNEKHKGQYPVANVLRPILTTNHQVDGLYMDPQDRRHYCAWSDAPKMEEADANAIYQWYENGGLDAVAHFLRTLDLSARNWNAKAPPPRTAWWHQLVAGGASQEEEKFADALDKLQRPEWITVPQVVEAGGLELASWVANPGNRRKVERELVKSGYQRLPNPSEKRGRWLLGGAQVAVYRRSDTPAKVLLAKFGL
jgi:hypothetical protein